jgi:hypothetical protein
MQSGNWRAILPSGKVVMTFASDTLTILNSGTTSISYEVVAPKRPTALLDRIEPGTLQDSQIQLRPAPARAA